MVPSPCRKYQPTLLFSSGAAVSAVTLSWKKNYSDERHLLHVLLVSMDLVHRMLNHFHVIGSQSSCSVKFFHIGDTLLAIILAPYLGVGKSGNYFGTILLIFEQGFCDHLDCSFHITIWKRFLVLCQTKLNLYCSPN